jgi:hypothetical protein
MKFNIYPILMAASLSFAGMALADDAPTAQPIKTPKQKMHECMTQERADHSAMSKDDMKKACAAKLQADENHPSRPQPSPDSTHN